MLCFSSMLCEKYCQLMLVVIVVAKLFRVVSIVILLVRGALGVNPVNIVKFKNIILSLVIGSCVLEAAAASIAVYFILDFPVEWAALMG